jgi:hypothetical protein
VVVSYDILANYDKLTGDFGAGNGPAPHPLSIVAWMKKTTAQWADSQAGVVCGLSGSTTAWWDTQDMSVAATPNNVIWSRSWDNDGDSNQAGNSIVGIAEDVWMVFVAVHESASSRKIYIKDSSDVGTESSTTTFDETDYRYIAVGGRPNNDFNYIRGKVAEVAVFDKVLSTDEIDKLWISAETGVPPNSIAPNDCIGYWPLDTDQANHADQSGNGGPTLAVQSDAPFSSDHPTIQSIQFGEIFNRVLKENTVITDPIPGSEL